MLVGKGSPHDSAWIMLLSTRTSLNLSKASQFGSTLADGHPFTAPPSLKVTDPQGILSKNQPRCAKYSCSGQVQRAMIGIHLLPAIRDLGFCESALALAEILESQTLPKVPLTGIFCTLERKKRQHAADKPERRRRITNAPQLGTKNPKST